MKRRLKISVLPCPDPADQLILKAWLVNLAHARKLVCRSLTASRTDAGIEPSSEALACIDAHFKLLALVMAQMQKIAVVLRGT